MTYDDIRKELANWTAFLRTLKKDISSGQIRNYVNVLNALRWLGKIIRSLEDVLNKKDNEIVRRKSDEIKNSRKELQGIVSHSISKPDSYIEVTERLDDLIDDSNNLSELLAEERQKIPASGGKAGLPDEKPAERKQKGKRGRHKKYTPEMVKQMNDMYEQHYEKNNDSKGSWGEVAKFFGIKSGKAVEMACRRYLHKQNK